MSKRKMYRCKDTLGRKSKAKYLFLNLPNDEFRQFLEQCKYLGVRPGDEFIYRTIEKSDLSKRYPLDVRKDFIEIEKIWWDTEKECRKTLASKTSTPEARSIATKILEVTSILHPLWIEMGARRRKDGDTCDFWKMDLTENQFM
jgi:hypothetical protein